MLASLSRGTYKLASVDTAAVAREDCEEQTLVCAEGDGHTLRVRGSGQAASWGLVCVAPLSFQRIVEGLWGGQLSSLLGAGRLQTSP